MYLDTTDTIVKDTLQIHYMTSLHHLVSVLPFANEEDTQNCKCTKQCRNLNAGNNNHVSKLRRVRILLSSLCCAGAVICRFMDNNCESVLNVFFYCISGIQVYCISDTATK